MLRLIDGLDKSANFSTHTASLQIVYTAGAFDLLHPGLVDFLEEAKKEGSYLIVGLYEDNVVNEYKGSQYPVQILQERVLSVLANRFVIIMQLCSCYTEHNNSMIRNSEFYWWKLL